MDEFDPNTVTHPWATYCPSRKSQAWKPHATRANAVSAIIIQRSGTLYEYVGDQWVERARVQPERFAKRNCDNCGAFLEKPNVVWDPVTQERVPAPSGRTHYVGHQGFVRDTSGAVKDPLEVLTVCTDCKRSLGV